MMPASTACAWRPSAEPGVLTAMHGPSAFAAPVPVEGSSGTAPIGAPPACQQPAPFGACVLGMPATRRRSEGPARAERGHPKSRDGASFPPRENAMVLNPRQWLGATGFGFALVVTARSPSRRKSASPSALSIALPPRIRHPCAMEDILSILENDVILRTGRAVKHQREMSGLSLRALATRSGVSPSMISDIERGTKSPTIVTLVRLAQALGVTAAALVDELTGSAPRIKVLRGGEGGGGDHPVPWHSLTSRAFDSRVDFARWHIPPSTVLGPASGHAPGTVEHLHVATGTIRVTVGDEIADLTTGDSCSCRTDVPHAVENSSSSAEALIYLIVERR